MAITEVGLTHEQYDGDTYTFTFAAEANPARLVARDATDPSKMTLAGAESEIVGVTLKPASPTDTNYRDKGPVKFLDAGGLFEVQTAETSVAVGDYLWPAANGLVSKTPAGNVLFQAMTALSAAGRLLVKRVPLTKVTRHVVTAGQGTANSATITTGWGVDVAVLSVLVNGSPVKAGLAAVNGTANGDVDVTATDLVAAEVITLVTTPSASS